ncbi:MAG: hypothetical protein KAJ52_01345, partial [Sedimentisphaerales bacterium]|nr:hypothetical protein [Sedimentisphaerales bacterium]
IMSDKKESGLSSLLSSEPINVEASPEQSPEQSSDSSPTQDQTESEKETPITSDTEDTSTKID